jgi:hypothetical protein
MSSPSSRKSATRPAFSRDWFRLAPSPSTVTFRQYSSRSAGIFWRAVSRPFRLRAIPQHSHMILPSSLWKESTVRLPLIDSRRSTRAATSVSAFLNSAWLVSTLSCLVVAR